MGSYTNRSKEVRFVEGRAVQPGETIPVPMYADNSGDAPAVIAQEKTAEETEAELDSKAREAWLRRVQGGTIAAISEDLSLLSNADLVRLVEIENEDGTPRKGVLELIGEENLRRAGAAVDAANNGTGDSQGDVPPVDPAAAAGRG